MTKGFTQANRLAAVWVRTALLFLMSACCVGQLAYAQAEISTHPSVVLVLKLVSATHVKPVTGIVVSNNGLVLVPAEFISDQDSSPETEIVVLDGGGDIFSHGRPATVKHAALPGGLAVLEVKGLARPGITLSEPGYHENAVFHLAAFPPAESIAKGEEPLWVAIGISGDAASGALEISPETNLPNVSGAIIDGCGYLAGLSIANGVQSLETGRSPTKLFYGALSHALESARINVPVAGCNPLQGYGPSINDKPVKALIETAAQDAGMEQQASGTVSEAPLQVTEKSDPAKQAAGTVVSQPEGAVTTPASVNNRSMSPAASTASLWSIIPWWIVAAGLIAISVLIWKLAFFIRLHKSGTHKRTGIDTQTAADEPDTTRLEVAARESEARPRSGHDDMVEFPGFSQLPEGRDAFVMLQGMLDPDTPFSQFCAIELNRCDISIGRGDADIRIEHPTISRKHSRLIIEIDSMTLSDLGSSNGTYIGAVPCLAGDIMFLNSSDPVFLGNVGFNIKIISQESDLQ